MIFSGRIWLFPFRKHLKSFLQCIICCIQWIRILLRLTMVNVNHGMGGFFWMGNDSAIWGNTSPPPQSLTYHNAITDWYSSFFSLPFKDTDLLHNLINSFFHQCTTFQLFPTDWLPLPVVTDLAYYSQNNQKRNSTLTSFQTKNPMHVAHYIIFKSMANSWLQHTWFFQFFTHLIESSRHMCKGNKTKM